LATSTELPYDWEQKELNDLIDPLRPICYGVLKPGEEDLHGVPLIRIVDMENNKVNTQRLFSISRKLDSEFKRSRLDGGELLISIQGTIGLVAVVPSQLRGANISRTVARVKIVRADVEYCKQFLMSEFGQKKIQDVVMGTTRDSLNISSLRKVKVSLPRSLSEQKKISAILQNVDNAIDETKEVIEKYNRIKQGLMQDLLDKRRSILGTDGKPIEKWESTTLGNLVTQHNAGVYKKADLYGSGRNIVGVSDLYYNESIDGQIFRLVKLSPEEADSYTLKEGDLIYGESSLVLEGIARTLYVTPRGEGTAFAWHTRRIRVNRKKVDPQFLHYLLSHETVRKQIMSVATQTALTGITTSDFFNIKLSLPDLTGQMCIRDRIKSIIDIIHAEQSYLEKLMKMKAGLMQDLLAGKVRVAA
jgi:type I restriction enzyme, S subunit